METKYLDTIDFLKCRKELNVLGITDKEINKAFKELNINKNDLCEEYPIKINSNNTVLYSTHEFLRTGTGYFTDTRSDGFEKRYTANANIYLIPAQYQGLKHGKIIFQILSNRYPWMKTFTKNKNYEESLVDKYIDTIGRLSIKDLPEELKKLTINEILEIKKEKKVLLESSWSLYEMYSVDYEMYLTTEFGSLYVPIKALINKDFSIIDKRMKSYSLSYNDPKYLSGYALNHRGRTKEEYQKDKIKDHENMIKPLYSQEAKLLKKFFKQN
jgi:hypothetical protein